MPERTLAPFGRRLCPVVSHVAIGAYDVIAVLDAEGPPPDPGQFYMLAASERWGGGADERPFLPRAFSVLRRHEDGRLEFLFENVGPGTRRLCELRAGDGLWLLGPLGVGFRAPEVELVDRQQQRTGHRARQGAPAAPQRVITWSWMSDDMDI